MTHRINVIGRSWGLDIAKHCGIYRDERAALLPIPSAPYALATWKKAKLHPDCHVVFDHAFYTAPHRLIGHWPVITRRRGHAPGTPEGSTLGDSHSPSATRRIGRGLRMNSCAPLEWR
jgi:hypothetical protein